MTGRGGEIRTPDILLPKQARYRAALHPERANYNIELSLGTKTDRAAIKVAMPRANTRAILQAHLRIQSRIAAGVIGRLKNTVVVKLFWTR